MHPSAASVARSSHGTTQAATTLPPGLVDGRLAPSFAEVPLFAAPGGGEPVPLAQRQRFEQRTGQAVGGVRLHTGEASQQTAVALSARAFTLGNDVHCARGEYQPGTQDGDPDTRRKIIKRVPP